MTVSLEWVASKEQGNCNLRYCLINQAAPRYCRRLFHEGCLYYEDRAAGVRAAYMLDVSDIRVS